jgi:hypothetical protein
MNTIGTIQDFFKAWENCDLKANERLLANDFVLTGPAPVPLDKNAFLVFQSVHNDAFPQWAFNARDYQENGDTVTCVYRITATQGGAYDVARFGIPIPPVPVSGIQPVWDDEYATFTVKNGQITKLDIKLSGKGGVPDILKQLGVKLP